MPTLMRIAAVLSGSLVAPGISACVPAARPDRGYSFQRGAAPAYSSTESPAGGFSYPTPSVSDAADLGSAEPIPAGYSEDRPHSAALTTYLHQHRLPLVGAQVFTNSSDRRVILHGYVATDFGKQDAAIKSRRYLNDLRLPVVNRVVVRPELLASSESGPSSSLAPSARTPGGSYRQDELGNLEKYESQAQQARNQRTQSEFNALILLIQLMGLLL